MNLTVNKTSAASLIFLFAFSATAVPQEIFHGVDALVGNVSNAASGQFNAVVFLLAPVQGGPPDRRFACTGVFISRNVILTAAHCLDAAVENPSGVTVWFGDIPNPADQPAANLIAHAVKVIQHPEYSRQKDDHGIDLGIVVLPSGSAQGIAPYPIFREVPKEGSEVVLVGYGSTKDRSISGIKTYGSSKIQMVFSDSNHLDIHGETGGCPGDSGGPALLRDGTSSDFKVVGVAKSVADDTWSMASLSLYSRVDTQAGWIDGFINQYDAQVEPRALVDMRPVPMNSARVGIDRVVAESLVRP